MQHGVEADATEPLSLLGALAGDTSVTPSHCDGRSGQWKLCPGGECASGPRSKGRTLVVLPLLWLPVRNVEDFNSACDVESPSFIMCVSEAVKSWGANVKPKAGDHQHPIWGEWEVCRRSQI